jgi:hypothetical protein
MTGLCGVGPAGDPCLEPATGAISVRTVPDVWRDLESAERTPGVVLMCRRHFLTAAADWDLDPRSRH